MGRRVDPHVGRHRASRLGRGLANRLMPTFIPNSSSPDSMPHSWFGVEDSEALRLKLLNSEPLARYGSKHDELS